MKKYKHFREPFNLNAYLTIDGKREIFKSLTLLPNEVFKIILLSSDEINFYFRLTWDLRIEKFLSDQDKWINAGPDIVLNDLFGKEIKIKKVYFLEEEFINVKNFCPDEAKDFPDEDYPCDEIEIFFKQILQINPYHPFSIPKKERFSGHEYKIYRLTEELDLEEYNVDKDSWLEVPTSEKDHVITNLLTKHYVLMPVKLKKESESI